MKFKKWIIKTGGVVALSKRIGVSPGAIWKWFEGVSHPKPRMMQKMVRLARGQVSYDDIINSTGVRK